MAAMSTRLSRMSRTSRKVNMPLRKAEGTWCRLNLKYAVTYRRASSERESATGVADRRPALRFQTRAADEQTIHTRRSEQRRRVGGVDTATVENRDRRAVVSGERAK